MDLVSPNIGPLDPADTTEIDGKLYLTSTGVQHALNLLNGHIRSDELFEATLEELNNGRPCRVCGCTNEQACVGMDAAGGLVMCAWEEPDLCTRCAGVEDDPSIQWVAKLEVRQ